MTGLLLVHGRSQELPAPLRQDPVQIAAHIKSITTTWLAGLAKGVVLAGRPPIPQDAVVLAFYGDLLADLVDARSSAPSPELEARTRAESGRPEAAPVAGSAVDDTLSQLVVDGAIQLGFQRRLERTDPGLGEAVSKARAAQAAGEEFAWSDLLRNAVVRSALQFLAEKTGTPQWIIERYLRDVAFYLKDEGVRGPVLDQVEQAVQALKDLGHEDMAVVGHSLGSVVAYDLCFQQILPVRLLVTAGSPLGFPAVLNNLPDIPHPPAPPPLAPQFGWQGPAWVNAFDPADVVALVHPLARVFGGLDNVRDEQTHNPDGPHAIQDYLADPDVAAPISQALE
jgi:hypothetical protein